MPGQSRRFQHWLEKYVFNPGMRLALRSGLAPRAFAPLETTGRRSGRRRQTPVGGGLIDDCFWLVSEHGQASAYVKLDGLIFRAFSSHPLTIRIDLED